MGLRFAGVGRRRQLGLGVYPKVSLEDARSKATQIRLGASEGRDVVAEQRQIERLAVTAAPRPTFRAAFEGYFEMKEPSPLRQAQGAMALDHASLRVPVLSHAPLLKSPPPR